jgi:hypothetical protein
MALLVSAFEHVKHIRFLTTDLLFPPRLFYYNNLTFWMSYTMTLQENDAFNPSSFEQQYRASWTRIPAFLHGCCWQVAPSIRHLANRYQFLDSFTWQSCRNFGVLARIHILETTAPRPANVFDMKVRLLSKVYVSHCCERRVGAWRLIKTWWLMSRWWPCLWNSSIISRSYPVLRTRWESQHILQIP